MIKEIKHERSLDFCEKCWRSNVEIGSWCDQGKFYFIVENRNLPTDFIYKLSVVGISNASNGEIMNNTEENGISDIPINSCSLRKENAINSLCNETGLSESEVKEIIYDNPRYSASQIQEFDELEIHRSYGGATFV